MPERDESHLDVLIAEDDVLLRQSLRLLLESHGYTCAEANNGKEAVQLVRQRLPHCILLDLAMPEVDGFTVARTLRADPTTKDIHIHCLTGLVDSGVRTAAMEAGCERFLTKPIDFSLLLLALQDPPASEQAFTDLTLAQAEELLDWLQNQTYPILGVTFEGQGVTVRFVCPAGHEVVRNPDWAVRIMDNG
jgi:CheY-like chemotaxis protein